MSDLLIHPLLRRVAAADRALYILFTSYFKVSKVVSHRLASAKLLGIFGGNEQNIADDSRQMFVPPPGYMFNQNDLEGAEAVVVALLCVEGAFRDCVRLKIKIHNFVCVKIFADKFYDLISPAEVECLTPQLFASHPNYKAIIKRCKTLTVEYDLSKRTVHGCLTDDHEVLTPAGWIPISSWAGQPIMVWKNGAAFFEVPQQFYQGRHIGEFHKLTNKHGSFDITVTDCHRMPYETNGNLKVCMPGQLPSGARLPYTGSYQPAILHLIQAELVQLLAAFQSDGTITPEGFVRFHLKKDRKILRLRKLVRQLDHFSHNDNTYNDGTTSITLSKELSMVLINNFGKQLGPYVLNWPAALMQTFLEEYQLWDGCIQATSQRLLTTNPVQADWLRTMAHLCNHAASVLMIERDESRQTLYNIGINQRKGAAYDSITHRTFNDDLPVYCFTTSTGFFYVRRNKAIMVTGNSNYQMGWKTFQATVLKNTRGRVVLSPAQCKRLLAMYFELFPEIKVYQALTHEKVKLALDIINLFGYEVKFIQRFTDELVRLAVSWGPQSTIGVLACLAAIKHQTYIEDNKLDWHLHNIVHDSCLQSAPEGEIVEAANRLDSHMRMELTSPVDGWKFTIGVEKSIGRNWGKKSETNVNGLEVVA